MSLPRPRPRGYLSTTIWELRNEDQRQRPLRSKDMLTSRTTSGVIRRPIGRAKGGSTVARWA